MVSEDKVDSACLTMLNRLWSFRLLNITVISNSAIDLILLSIPLAQKGLHCLVKLSL